MTEIILARHGETEWNVKDIFRGLADIALSNNGLKQAEKLARYLSSRKIEAVYSSPLQRARQTAELIARHHRLDVLVTPGLIDVNYGEWQGLLATQVQEKYPELYTLWSNQPQRVRIPGGDRLSQVRRRSRAVVAEVINKYSGTVVLVSHRAVNQVLICALLGVSTSHFWNVKLDVAGTTTFTYENDRFVLVEHNNTSYLR
jgi:probable phosphoglycerate mutase